MRIVAREPQEEVVSRRLSGLARQLVQHWDAAVLLLAFLAAFRTLLRALPKIWFSADTYYAHGAIVPICAGIILLETWPSVSKRPLKGSGYALLLLAPTLYLQWLALRTGLYGLQSVLFVLTLAESVLFLAGSSWLRSLAPAIFFLALGLPVFDGFVEANTQASQRLSTDASYGILQAIGMHPRRLDPTVIKLPHYTMDVAVPCSGLKTLLAVITFSVFFVFVAKLKGWQNILLLAAAFPLALAVNAIRITGIGIVGNVWGTQAAHSFHDYSGYISLAICLALQYALTRALGWK